MFLGDRGTWCLRQCCRILFSVRRFNIRAIPLERRSRGRVFLSGARRVLFSTLLLSLSLACPVSICILLRYLGADGWQGVLVFFF